MSRKASLTTRAFLFSFVPVCLVLAGTFIALSAVVEQRVKQGLRESLQRSQDLVARANEESRKRVSQLVAALADSAGLKAAVGLLRDAGAQKNGDEIRRTIEAQLRELHALVGYDLLAVTDWKGRTAAAVEYQGSEVRSPAQLPEMAAPGLVETGGTLYELASTPITIDGEQIGELKLGSKFDLSRYHLSGETALVRDGRIVRATIPAGTWAGIEEELRRRCARSDAECEVSRAGETLLAMPIREMHLGPGYRLLAFRSLDKAVKDFTSGWMPILAEVAIGGVLLALVSTAVTSRSVSKPLRELVSQLGQAEQASHFPERITAGEGVGELHLLAETFNRVAAAEQRSRAELEKSKTAAEAANRAKTEFLANVSHELRTPMNGVLGLNDLLLDSPLEEQQQQYASMVRDSAQALLVVINDILDFSSLEAGRTVLSARGFDLRQTLQESVGLFSAEATAKALALSLRYATPVPPRLSGDPVRIRQLMTNLIGNAIKFTERGSVEVRVESAERREGQATIQIEVIDTGVGIPADKLDLIFDKFTQADGSLSRRYGGMGLGLAIVKQLVDLMGGEVGVESRSGAGSTFRVRLDLPVIPEESPAAAEEAPALSETRS